MEDDDTAIAYHDTRFGGVCPIILQSQRQCQYQRDSSVLTAPQGPAVLINGNYGAMTKKQILIDAKVLRSRALPRLIYRIVTPGNQLAFVKGTNLLSS
jgi:hypothetical protein